MAEWSKALRSGRSPVLWARVQIPLLTMIEIWIPIRFETFLFDPPYLYADVAEWLRRLTRNQFLSGSVGSNPTICALYWLAIMKRELNNA